MTPLQRAAAIARGEQADRLPCNPNIANGAARIFGCRISQFNTDARVLADAQIATYRRFGSDGVRIFTDLFVWAEAMGAKVKAPEDHTVDLAAPAAQNVADIDRLRPADPRKDGRLPIHLRAMDHLLDAIGAEVGCSAGLVGPFTNAFFLYGVDESFRLMRKNPRAFHQLCALSLETCLAYAGAAIEKGLTPTISEPMSSCSVVSPAVFREFSLPYLKQLVAFIRDAGRAPVMHICGATDRIWTDIADLGVAGFSVDNVVDLRACCQTIGAKTKILGNVDPAGVMFAGTVEDVRRKTLDCILAGHDSPKGFVVMSGCSLPVETPAENIDAMMQTVAEVGYPVRRERVLDLLDRLELAPA
ncbi:uroporphyrinogen decarboxylase [Rhodoblastus acidophilus]|uniref:uroporphyrinogen decarboxylase family protein n=1 Tax=Rhodoblastus acidophilus TaxID=1074 RepID=UPI002224B150|nr:uroporphyrinogen decarboxylase family protein [Rhodoblastus acidophilus]MCW2285434.1 uroporphyrinogen decarboxylase [Rhodoblastus acidophilus]MCW2334317.1 uroporphyrinogen decarboxylase [Rhodoblastus acidophilus]